MSRNALFFAAMCLVWGLTFLPVKIAAEHVPPIFFAAARFVIAGPLLLLWAGRDALRVPADARWRLLGTAMLVNTACYALVFWGTAHAPSGLAAIVNLSSIPIWSLLASRLVEGTRITGRQVLAVGLGLFGLCFLFWTRAAEGLNTAARDPLELWGLASVALGTLSYCTGAVLTRAIAPSIPTLALAGWQSTIGAVGLVALSLLIEPVTRGHLAALVSWPTAQALGFIIVAGSLVGYTVYLRLLRDWGAFRAGLYAFVSPVIAVAAGIVVLDEPFGWAEGVGAVLMFAAAAIALRR
ncbi:MAG TPA: EamA family transporter [Bosea sp. (in: a-proteobacteria)]|jgi:drug/metabolite transporter (DMT)-like permease|uniref:DMT family transporter n=1 Tax=Bosea sp. (in: a-proteobacteria) TaxID=1871050 RepID=UPI002DDCC6AD|nr:EamA family transporter [Bosea sp. (in: a-proteobacteria)]HEV2552765.1 EamA family transporter [Bosea sp. (in: a-proteobacteria)]